MPKILLDWAHWLYGLAAALVGGFFGGISAAVSTMIVDPADFNLDGGFNKLAKVMGVSALVGAVTHLGAYLKQSPLPKEWDGVDRRSARELADSADGQ